MQSTEEENNIDKDFTKKEEYFRLGQKDILCFQHAEYEIK